MLLADCQILHFVMCCDMFEKRGNDGRTVRPISKQYEATSDSCMVTAAT